MSIPQGAIYLGQHQDYYSFRLNNYEVICEYKIQDSSTISLNKFINYTTKRGYGRSFFCFTLNWIADNIEGIKYVEVDPLPLYVYGQKMDEAKLKDYYINELGFEKTENPFILDSDIDHLISRCQQRGGKKRSVKSKSKKRSVKSKSKKNKRK